MSCFLFGQIGAGKSSLGLAAAQAWGIPFHEGDDDLTPALIAAIRARQPFTTAMRTEFAHRLIERISTLQTGPQPFVIAQGLFYNEQRHLLRAAHPQLQWVWVQARPEVWSQRLQRRTHPLADLSYAQLANPYFEAPDFPCTSVVNNGDLQESLAQLHPLLYPPRSQS